jgi:hypothetical protein
MLRGKQSMSEEVKATSMTMLPFSFPAYLVLEINGGYKLMDPARHFNIFKQRIEAKCPFAGAWANMSAQERLSGLIKVKANLRLKDDTLTIRVDNFHGKFHLDVESNKVKTEKPTLVVIDSAKPLLLSALEKAKKELLLRASQLLPSFGSVERLTLELLTRLWAAKYFINKIGVQVLLPPYPGSRLTGRIYTASGLPFRLEPTGVDLTVVPFQWEKHTSPPPA